jgi:hypothetical protein
MAPTDFHFCIAGDMQRLATPEILLPLAFYVFRISVRNMTVLLVPVILTYHQHLVSF